MSPNPWLKRLGFSDEDRVLILHTDDVGMCWASLDAYQDLVDFGLISTGSTMVPCPWFPAVAEFCRTYSGEIDLGVHLTLTSEWSGYRWGPVSTRDTGSGLLDAEGYLPRTNEEIASQGWPEVVRKEIHAQLTKALDTGIDVTHLDTHMGTALHPDYARAYIEAALSHHVPPFLVRFGEAMLHERDRLAESGMTEEEAQDVLAQIRALEAQGLPILDHILSFPLDQPEDRLGFLEQILETLPPGLTYLINHAAKDTPELRAITPDWRGRVADYEAMTSPETRSLIAGSGVQVIGWRVIRDLMRRAG